MRSVCRLMLILVAILAATVCGCVPNHARILVPGVTPNPPPVQTVRVEVVGDSKINVGGEAKITTQAAAPSSPLCSCGCGHRSDQCDPSCPNLAKSARGAVQYQRVCNPVTGYCQMVPVPSTAASSGLATAVTGGQKIRILYAQEDDTIRVMKRDLAGVRGLDFDRVAWNQIPVINGVHNSPTAVKPNGAAWTPGSWTNASAGQFSAWASQ